MVHSPIFKRIVHAVSVTHTALIRLVGGKGILARNCLLLTTRGRKSGRDVTTPLIYIAEGEKLYVVGSFGGSDTAPNWYLNLKKTPEVRVEVQGTTGTYRARTVEPDEKARLWPKLLAVYAPYESYQKNTTRVIPVVELAPA